MNQAALSDLSRRLENLLALGTIAAVDHGSARLRVELAGRLTGWLPWPAEIGANFRRWRPLRTGTQVLVACPSGDPANALIVQILYTAALAPPADAAEVDLIQWEDGTLVRYDSAARRMEVVSAGDLAARAAGDITAQAGGNVDITAAQTARIAARNVQIVATEGGAGAARMTGSFHLEGDLQVDGSVHAGGDILAGGANSNHHSH